MKKEKLKNFGIDVASGAAIGVAAAIPGVSGGTIAIMTKVYDRHLDHMNNLKTKRFFYNLACLLPLLLGVIVGFIPAFVGIKYSFDVFAFGIVSLFAGLILGGMPSLFKEVKGHKVKPIYIILLIAAFVLAASLGILSALLGDKTNIKESFTITKDSGCKWWIYLALIPMGVIATIALIVPGISGSMIMLVTGFYQPLADTVENWIDIFKGNGSWLMAGSLIGCYLCLLLGMIIGFFTIVKLLQLALDKFHVESFYAIIGFVLGSFVSLYLNNDIYTYYQAWAANDIKGLPIVWEVVLAGVLLILGCLGSFFLAKLSDKKQSKNSDTPEEQ